jgi:hypothetical protein
MTEKSSKNILQEYCQVNKLSLPRYFSESQGPSHRAIWSSYVVVDDIKFPSQSYAHSSKILAEQDAAEQAYNFYKEEIPPTIDIFVHKIPTWIALIDIENLQPILDRNKPVEYHLFMSEYSAVDTGKYEICAPYIHKIDSSNTDAADHFMTYHAAKLTLQKPIRQYIILSRDKASGILATILAQEGFLVKHFKEVNTFHSFINGL